MLIIVVDFFKTNQYAEQRFDSRKKPTTRAALKIKSILQVLAEESEKGSTSEKRQWAKSLLEYLTKYDTLLLLGLEADFLTEFSKWVHAEDRLDPDPSRTLVRQIQA